MTTANPLANGQPPAAPPVPAGAASSGGGRPPDDGAVDDYIGSTAPIFKFFWAVGQFDLALAVLGTAFAASALGIQLEDQRVFTAAEFAACLGFGAIQILVGGYIHVTQLRTGRRFRIGQTNPPATNPGTQTS